MRAATAVPTSFSVFSSKTDFALLFCLCRHADDGVAPRLLRQPWIVRLSLVDPGSTLAARTTTARGVTRLRLTLFLSLLRALASAKALARVTAVSSPQRVRSGSRTRSNSTRSRAALASRLSTCQERRAWRGSPEPEHASGRLAFLIFLFFELLLAAAAVASSSRRSCVSKTPDSLGSPSVSSSDASASSDGSLHRLLDRHAAKVWKLGSFSCLIFRFVFLHSLTFLFLLPPFLAYVPHPLIGAPLSPSPSLHSASCSLRKQGALPPSETARPPLLLPARYAPDHPCHRHAGWERTSPKLRFPLQAKRSKVHGSRPRSKLVDNTNRADRTVLGRAAALRAKTLEKSRADVAKSLLKQEEHAAGSDEAAVRELLRAHNKVRPSGALAWIKQTPFWPVRRAADLFLLHSTTIQALQGRKAKYDINGRRLAAA